jgi:hypothetical protein
MESDSNLSELDWKLQASLDSVVDWSDCKRLTIAPTKSLVTLYTPWNRQMKVHPNISINGVPVPLDPYIKWLGVNFDPLFDSSRQVSCLKTKFPQSKNLVKAVSGSDWGHDKGTLLPTYRALVESVYTFCAPIWFPNCKPSNITRLQIIQSAAMRLMTGCHMASSIAHLHSETSLLPVKEHLSMLCAQYLASCLCRCHPSHNVVQLPPGPWRNHHGRPLKETLASKFHDTIENHLLNGIVPETSYNRIRNDNHTSAVRDYLSSAAPNKAGRPPEVSISEQTLSQAYRHTLAQLKDNRCSSLRTYQFFIKKTNDDICPSCHLAPETVLHLFSCSTNPTHLNLLAMWRIPVEAARFLSTHPHFNHLPPAHLPPRPPPEPPP